MAERRPDIARECSPFLDRLIDRHPDWFASLQSSGRLDPDSPPERRRLREEIAGRGLDAGLRRYRNREMMRIVWRELNSVATLEQTMEDLSTLADLTIRQALETHTEAMQERFGIPRDEDGNEQSLIVLALGKLGGRELNLSSDIDIMFCYPSTGECDGRRGLANEQFFTRLARAVIKSLSDVTAEGFCFRVDTRLRPFGDSGPLVCSFGALELYYQREGRDWERYALIKARPVTGAPDAGEQLLKMFNPFVYRRYIDFGAVEALRDMLTSIREDSARKSRAGDIKRGPGGIREIEFLVQCVQLLRGGREPALQTNSLLKALDQLQLLKIFSPERVAFLRTSYGFLRRLENAIQALHDRQTHELPAGEDLDRVRKVMGCTSTAELQDQLAEVRAGVSDALDRSFPEARDRESPPKSWPAMLEEMPDMAHDVFERFRSRLARHALSQRASGRLDRFMPMLLERMREREIRSSVQADVLELVLAICRRSAYLSLLVQNPQAIDRMLELFSASDWIASRVIRHPALLDELIDPSLGRHNPDREELTAHVDRTLSTRADTESVLAALNHLKSSSALRTAVAELEGNLSAMGAEAQLTVVAEVILAGCLELSMDPMRERHGVLPASEVAVIGYGTLGARAMSYDSDLDLVFLYASSREQSDGERPLPAEQYWTRMTRRLLALTTTITPSGRLYEIDARLRPNGRAGLLVSSLDAFERYQTEEAWIWELQALVRARPVAGDGAVGARFSEIRRKVLASPRGGEALRSEVRSMRQRMRAEGDQEEEFKHARGGLLDIDFVVQLGVLESACDAPALLEYTHTGDQLQGLADCGWLSRNEADVLRKVREALVRARHLNVLSPTATPKMPDVADCWDICSRYLE